jgi:tetratricopeptide (TPR) repeat protein
MDRIPSIRVAGWILTSVGLLGPLCLVGWTGCGTATTSAPSAFASRHVGDSSSADATARLTPCGLTRQAAFAESPGATPNAVAANRPASYSAETADPCDGDAHLARLSQIRPVPLADGPALTADEMKALSPLQPSDELPELQFPQSAVEEAIAATADPKAALPTPSPTGAPSTVDQSAGAAEATNPAAERQPSSAEAPTSVVQEPVAQSAMPEPMAVPAAPQPDAAQPSAAPPVMPPVKTQPELARAALSPPRPLDAVASSNATATAGPVYRPGSEHIPRSAEMDAVVHQASAANRHAFELAEHGAIYSARAEFIVALRTIAEALDARQDNNDHLRMLEAGLKALEELDDFGGRDLGSGDELNLDQIVAGHRTPVLKELLQDPPSGKITAHRAMSLYLTYAEQKLAACCADVPAGSAALYGLGKIYTVPDSAHGPADATHGAKAVAFHEAALAVDARNFRSANELGVLLVRFGRLPEARSALLHSLAVSPQPTAWQNLAAVHRALGQNQLAEAASREAQLLATRQQQAGMAAAGSATQVRWVDPATFARSSPLPIDASPGANPQQAAAQHSVAQTLPSSTSPR